MEKRNKLLKDLLAKIPDLILLFVIVIIAAGYYVCPFYYLFDIPCPGCGMTRACKALLRFDFQAAINYNCLFPIPIFWALYQPLRRYIRTNKTLEFILVLVSALLFIIRWIIILFLY